MTSPKIIASGKEQRIKGGCLTWVKRISLTLLMIVIGLSSVGAAYQIISTQIDKNRYPAPGRLIDIGGYRLHLYCIGNQVDNSPTVILEQGLGGTSPAWGLIQ